MFDINQTSFYFILFYFRDNKRTNQNYGKINCWSQCSSRRICRQVFDRFLKGIRNRTVDLHKYGTDPRTSKNYASSCKRYKRMNKEMGKININESQTTGFKSAQLTGLRYGCVRPFDDMLVNQRHIFQILFIIHFKKYAIYF